MANNNPGTPNNGAALKIVIGIADYIENLAELGLPVNVPVKVNNALHGDLPRVLRIIQTDAGFKRALASAAGSQGAVAIPADGKARVIPFPSNIFGVRAGGSVASGQSFALDSLLSQVHFIVDMFGTQQGAMNKPLRGAQLSGYEVNGNTGNFTVTLKNGKKVKVTIEAQ